MRKFGTIEFFSLRSKKFRDVRSLANVCAGTLPTFVTFAIATGNRFVEIDNGEDAEPLRHQSTLPIAPTEKELDLMSTVNTPEPGENSEGPDLMAAQRRRHLDWSKKQGRILTSDGMATQFYQKCSFEPEELPHHHLLSNQSHEAFKGWSAKADNNKSLVTGAWTRSLFYGGWEHSTSLDEITYNLQSPTLFIDLRIPTTRRELLPSSARSLGDYDDFQLRVYARQHIFSGYTRLCWQEGRPVCTRLHCIDWNFIGTNPRPIPNKWWVEMRQDKKKWKEWAYPTDENGQHYYCEHWEQLEGGNGNGVTLALRKKQSDGPDGVFVVVNDHFSYVIGRIMTGNEAEYPDAGSLVDLVDQAIASGDRRTAESYLSIDGGHGRISKGWQLDCAIQPWKEGTRISKIEVLHGTDDDVRSCRITWMGSEWEVCSCSLSSVTELKKLFPSKGAR